MDHAWKEELKVVLDGNPISRKNYIKELENVSVSIASLMLL